MPGRGGGEYIDDRTKKTPKKQHTNTRESSWVPRDQLGIIPPPLPGLSVKLTVDPWLRPVRTRSLEIQRWRWRWRV